ncbi:MAG TPA: hypothetical protein VE444_04905 [Gaiellaceae bacterium]|nr:hypothetical protein [Gaiellaceae bacterium]
MIQKLPRNPIRDSGREELPPNRFARAVGARDRVEQDVDRLSCGDGVASRLRVELARERRDELFPLARQLIVRRAWLADRHTFGGRAGEHGRRGIEDLRCHELDVGGETDAKLGQQSDALRT